MNVKLNFINQSNDQNKSEVVIFQKNVATDFDEIVVAWKVIRNCGQGWGHKFDFPINFQIASGDSYGNILTPITTYKGQKWDVVQSYSGDTLKLNRAAATNKNGVEIKNNLPTGAIDASIYKNGRLLAIKSNIAPGQKAIFEFKPTIWIGVVSQIIEGGVMNSAILSSVNTELSLEGIKSADIVMTGGGTGPNATEFKFILENVVSLN